MALTKGAGIPKIIHQIWIGPNPKPTIWMDTFVSFCKEYGYEYVLWTESNIDSLEWAKFPGLRELYDSLGNGYAAKSDILRYLFIYSKGGVYIDADSVMMKPQKFADFMETNKARVFAAYEEFKEEDKPKQPQIQGDFIEGNKLVTQGVIAAVQHHPFMESTCREVVEHAKHEQNKSDWILVGPVFFTRHYTKYKKDYPDITIYPMKFFYPISWHGISDPELHKKIEIPGESMLFQYGYNTNGFADIFRKKEAAEKGEQKGEQTGGRRRRTRRRVRFSRVHKSRKPAIKRGKNRIRQRGGTEPPKRPPASINDHIHHVIYINLDSRTDRREQVEKEIDIFPNEKKTRLSAIEDKTYPRIGCLRSHLKALETAKEKNYPNVLITEDDFMWANVTDGYADFEKLLKNPYDVIMLGGTWVEMDPTTHRINLASTTHGYLVNNRYYDTIISKLKGSISDFESNVSKEKADKIAVDLQYRELQPLGQWFLVQPALAIQRPSFSDIEKSNVNYTGYFNK